MPPKRKATSVAASKAKKPAWRAHESEMLRRAQHRAMLRHLPLVKTLKECMKSGNLKEAVPAFLSVIAEQQDLQTYRAGKVLSLADLDALTITPAGKRNTWMEYVPPAHERVAGEPLSICEIVRACIGTENGANALAEAMLCGATGFIIPTPTFYNHFDFYRGHYQTSDFGTTTIKVMTKAQYKILYDAGQEDDQHIACYTTNDFLPEGTDYNVLVYREKTYHDSKWYTNITVLFYEDTANGGSKWAVPVHKQYPQTIDVSWISKAACAMIAYQFDPPNSKGRAILRASFVDKASAAFCLNNTANDFSR